tara:strand:- start:386 stop:1096 length:711 start_codon:yes stop_codon:yes gene_type:complete
VRAAGAIARRELAALFGEGAGWLLLGALALVQAIHGVAFALDERRTAEAALAIDLHHAGYGMEIGALALVALSARDAHAALLWRTSAVRTGAVVAGRLAADLGWLALAVLVSLPVPLLVATSGAIGTGHLVAGALGLFGVGLVAVTLARAAVARLGLGGVLAAGALLGALELAPLAADHVPAGVRGVLSEAGPVWSHLDTLRRGVVDGADLAFFAAIALVAVALTVAGQEERRWGH